MSNHISPESIAAERAYQQRERAEVERLTGIVITDSGASLPPEKIRCVEGCTFVASAKTVGRAIRSLAPHLVLVHGWAIPAEGTKE